MQFDNLKMKGETPEDQAPELYENRRFPRYPIEVDAFFIGSDLKEVEGIVENASAVGVSIRTKTPPKTGERFILYSELMGRLECRAVRRHPRGFAAEIEATPLKQERLARLLKWAASQISAGRTFRRAHERIIPRHARTTLRLRDGGASECLIKNFSRAGAAVISDVIPPIGALVTLGAQRSRVVRHMTAGFAVEYLRLIPLELFDETFVL